MGIIQLAHGGGGKFTEELVEEVFLRAYSPDSGEALEDLAILDSTAMRWAFSSDSFTVKPLFFPGGDIGRLAVCGTVNDLLMRGARPRYLSSSFIIEEGLEIETLKAVVASMAKACEEAGVKIVTGDTKVVPKGEVDELFINTSGIGEVEPELDISIKNAKPGDAIIISGTIGDHGMAILSTRGSFSFDPPLESDCAPLVEIVEAIKKFPGAVKLLRDPTRGGVAEVLYNISEASGVGIEILEEALPVKPQVQSACEMLGLEHPPTSQ